MGEHVDCNIVPIRPTVGMSEIDQLRAFVAWEQENNPEKTHIAAWALFEIERLHAATSELVRSNAGLCLPCPFCGAIDCEAGTVEDTGVYDERGGFLHSYYEVWCNSCNATGPTKDTFEDSITAWNSRHNIQINRQADILPTEK